MKITPQQLVRFNLFATIGWLCMIPPTLLWWKESILWIALMSIWANVVGHFSSWIAARAEKVSAENPPQDRQ